MASSPPASPIPTRRRPMSAIVKSQPRSSSRLSMASRPGDDSRASDEDVRTAVRVAVRVRPPLNPDDPGFDLIPQRFQRSMVQTTSNTSLAIDSPQGKKLFVFDRVFGPEVMQDGIWDYLAESITAFTQGYNVSLLAYGQSGAGKSYTMGTSNPDDDDPDGMGVIPRAAAALFDMLDTPTGAGSGLGTQRVTSSLRSPREYGQQNVLGDRNWSLRATYVEIYNEQLRDLLVSETTPLGDRSSVAIREDVKGNIILTGLRQVEINSVEDLLNALNFGSSIRQTDATAINAKSSRSHAVFSLNLVQRKSRTSGGDKRLSVPLEAMTGQDISVTTDSKLHFVDLAGSERLKNTGAQGERAREGISINGGLASLGKVISQLSSRQSGSHVSYRDSKLTRLLQDSLGGNAITYMVACVTQAEFHLSETLNTVQYAQRARAIQSKPRIQAVEEGDKQAVIDRLKAEVAFLRDQIRSASGRNDSPRRSPGLIDRAERSNEREVELQNQLLDTQESYTALGQRHARLISQMARAQESEAERDHQIDALQGENATDRLNRSNSFAQAVEQVVLEYEKTIQSLEQSLTSTRTTLSNTETNLLERETKCAYVETINSQMQSRLQKLMDREANTENYLHDLEAKLDGHTSGEEKNATIIMELRKEIARVRENEASCEDYISTLEERLAEADQDAELMQREIDKLEQIVERQRSLGKLDTLLYELDHVDNKADNATEAVNGDASRDALANTEDLVNGQEEHGGDVTKSKQNPQIEAVERSASVSRSRGHSSQNSAQSRFVADKLETVTQELVDLRVEHEATVNEYDALNTKYDEAMLKLAELQDTIDEARHPSRIRDSVLSIAVPTGTRPSSTISDARTNDLKDNPRSSASRSLSSELSSALGSSATAETSNAGADTEDDETATAKPASTEDLKHEQTEHLSAELERLRALAEEKDASEKELASKYAELEEKHSETLDIVEELKTEVYKARAVEASSPRTSTPVIRRKSSQNLLTVDRAHRSIASLRHIAAESFEGRPEVMQNFELNLNTAMHELLTRSERIQELEADVTAAKKEMETKMTIISGLTRERSSLKTSPMDISMVASLRDQLEQSERQMYDMRMGHVSREQELHAEIQKLQEAMHSPSSSTRAAVINAEEDEETRQLREEKVTALQSELAEWENKHKAALESMTTTEQEMRTTIQQLEAQLDSANKRLIESRTESDTEKDHAVTKVEQQHQSLVNFLRSEIDEYKAIINTNAAKFAELESAHLAAASELDNIKSSHGTAAEEASRHQDLVSRLETQILSHQKSTSEHQESLDLLKTTHAKELAELKAHEQSSYEQQVEVLMTEHAEAVQKLELDLSSARDDLMNVAVHVANALGSDISVENLTERIDGLIADHKTLAQEQKRADDLTAQIDDLTAVHESVLRDLESAKSTLHELSPEDSAVVTSSSFADQLSHIKNRFSDLDGRNKKNSRLIEELEEQLQNNFDEAQVTTNRLSTLQSERNAQLEEANVARAKLQADLETIREDFASLQAKYNEAVPNGDVKRSNSNSTIRKSSSHTSLPSPPPAIPLPPLPSGAAGGPSVNGGTTSPTANRPGSKDNINISQITEDQEARIRSIEKHLYAERQLTQTLEEALTDLEKQSKKVKSDCDAWKKRAQELEGEVKELKDRPAESLQDNRWSMHAVEEERKKRQAAEAARKQLEERMNAISKGKKKKGSLNCF